jgi:hypothetical protein
VAILHAAALLWFKGPGTGPFPLGVQAPTRVRRAASVSAGTLRNTVRRVTAALACCWALSASTSAAGEEWSEGDVPVKGEAVLVGSSSFTQPFGFIIARELERWGYDVTRKGVPGAGLARPDYHDMNQVLDALPIGPNTAAVFVYLGVNDAQALWLHPHERDASGQASLPFASAAWEAMYLQRTREFYERICKRGAQRAIVLLPVDVNRAGLSQNLEKIRSLQVQAAAQTSCGVALSTAGDAGHFEVNGVAMRLPDGYHMSSRGAQLVWDRVRGQVQSLLDRAR